MLILNRFEFNLIQIPDVAFTEDCLFSFSHHWSSGKREIGADDLGEETYLFVFVFSNILTLIWVGFHLEIHRWYKEHIPVRIDQRREGIPLVLSCKTELPVLLKL